MLCVGKTPTLVRIPLLPRSSTRLTSYSDLYAVPITDRVIRRIPNDGPVTNILIADLTCNRLGENASSLLATVSAGGTVKVCASSCPFAVVLLTLWNTSGELQYIWPRWMPLYLNTPVGSGTSGSPTILGPFGRTWHRVVATARRSTLALMPAGRI
jgi:hypothetical protein